LRLALCPLPHVPLGGRPWGPLPCSDNASASALQRAHGPRLRDSRGRELASLRHAADGAWGQRTAMSRFESGTRTARGRGPHGRPPGGRAAGAVRSWSCGRARLFDAATVISSSRRRSPGRVSRSSVRQDPPTATWGWSYFARANRSYSKPLQVCASRRCRRGSGEKARAVARKFQGKKYDLAFEWSDERMYCSELVWKIYKEALDVEIGSLQRLREFHLEDPVVKGKLRERYGHEIPLEEPVIPSCDVRVARARNRHRQVSGSPTSCTNDGTQRGSGVTSFPKRLWWRLASRPSHPNAKGRSWGPLSRAVRVPD
jgi:Permuted papain-like amidase enzyme, YaeF/YiiX, C92 family